MKTKVERLQVADEHAQKFINSQYKGSENTLTSGRKPNAALEEE